MFSINLVNKDKSEHVVGGFMGFSGEVGDVWRSRDFAEAMGLDCERGFRPGTQRSKLSP